MTPEQQQQIQEAKAAGERRVMLRFTTKQREPSVSLDRLIEVLGLRLMQEIAR